MKDRLKKLDIPLGQAPEENLPVGRKCDKSKGQTSPRGGKPKKLG